MPKPLNDDTLLDAAREEIKMIEKAPKKAEQIKNTVKWRENPKEVFVAVHRATPQYKIRAALTFLIGESCESSLSIPLTKKQYQKLKELGFFIV